MQKKMANTIQKSSNHTALTICESPYGKHAYFFNSRLKCRRQKDRRTTQKQCPLIPTGRIFFNVFFVSYFYLIRFYRHLIMYLTLLKGHLGEEVATMDRPCIKKYNYNSYKNKKVSNIVNINSYIVSFHQLSIYIY